jgi:hypothetical protein
MKAADIQKKWETTTICAKMARFAKRQNLSDYERFSVMINRRKRSAEIKKNSSGASAKKGAAPAKKAAAAAKKGKK